jgi:hypothetical protein
MGRRMNRDGYKEKLFIIDSFLWHILLI